MMNFYFEFKVGGGNDRCKISSCHLVRSKLPNLKHIERDSYNGKLSKTLFLQILFYQCVRPCMKNESWKRGNEDGEDNENEYCENMKKVV